MPRSAAYDLPKRRPPPGISAASRHADFATLTLSPTGDLYFMVFRRLDQKSGSRTILSSVFGKQIPRPARFTRSLDLTRISSLKLFQSFRPLHSQGESSFIRLT